MRLPERNVGWPLLAVTGRNDDSGRSAQATGDCEFVTLRLLAVNGLTATPTCDAIKPHGASLAMA